MNTPDERPIQQQLKDALQDLERKAQDFRTQQRNPSHVEQHCSETEKEWTEKLEEAGRQHLTAGMKTAVDAIRNEQEPDLTFTSEKRPEFKLTAEATRRLAEHKQKKNLDRDLNFP